MREIEFQEVGMENYGPYIDPLILEFVNDTLTLVTGPNGVGKTMALDAILFTLYGITSRGMRGDDVVNNVVGRNCKTWVKFRSDETQYTVTRYHKYTKLGNTVILNVGGVDTKKGHKEVTPEIERILSPRKTFTNTLMFGQKVKDFFTDLTDSDKKEIFRQILNLIKYVKYHTEVSNKLKKIIMDYAEVAKGELVKDEVLKSTQTQIKILENQQREFEIEKEKKLKEIEAKISKNLMLKLSWDDKLKKQLLIEVPDTYDIAKAISDVEAQLNQLSETQDSQCQGLSHQRELKINDLRNHEQFEVTKLSKASQEDKDKLQTKETALKDQLTEFLSFNQEQRHELENLTIKLHTDSLHYTAEADKLYENVIEADIATCPTCDTDLTEDKIKEISKKIKGYHDAVKAANQESEKIEENMKTLRHHMAENSELINEQRDKLKSKIELVNANYTKNALELHIRLTEAIDKVDKSFRGAMDSLHLGFKDDRKHLELKLQVLNEQKETIDQNNKIVDEIQDALKNLKTERDKLGMQYDLESDTEYNEAQLIAHKREEVALQSQILVLLDQRERLIRKKDIYEFWKQAYSPSGIPSMLIDEAIPFMNKKISEYLDKLTNGRYVVSFDTLAATKAGEFRDKISVNVLDTFTRANSRVQLSGGQTRIIDIATILTLGDLQSNIQNMKVNILVFDEIFDSLDDENIMQVSKVLNKLKIGKSIYLISHRHEDQLEADEVLAMQ